MLRCGAVYAGIRGSRGGGVLRRLRSRRRDARHGATARARRHLALSSGSEEGIRCFTLLHGREQVEGSYFDRFYKQTADMDPAQRASFLEEDEEMEKAHSVAVSAGDTEAKDGVIEHYVCFSCVDDEIFELDGGNSQPISHGPSSPDSLLQDAAKVIKARIAQYPGSLNFNVMALSKQ
ncbi:Os04g0546400 [Oryza sativa Japonica Group]|uniref:ubiquitinyl hydrolase 1 n=1 Tax=Oryza sativa subsp. japonica TaxID=39947 RepID=Q0JBA1_ORYSJ|nr:Os04g0546400 [Oryza sativa Japonica Group]|eukprot:NP_001053472.1 Os04g0546400 [Oryza sativa Japonica Group]